MSLPELDLPTLQAAVRGGVAAIRALTRLQPAGGPGDKVFPPTYATDKKGVSTYAKETRLVEGRQLNSVLLDSVASQANRMEEALLEGWRNGELRFPLVQVDFSGEPELEDLGQITALQAPHRIADAILRDSLLDGQPFRHTSVGKAFTDARLNHATAMYRYCPTALIFGVWDSTGPKGGLGTKFQRALVSEIVAINVSYGVRTWSRIDPLAIEKVPLYHRQDDGREWTTEKSEAQVDGKGNPVPFSQGSSEKKGTPSSVIHGNIAPSVSGDGAPGGVTMDHALQSTVLSLPALRRLRFQVDNEGRPLGERRSAAEQAARTALAALALSAVSYQRENGYDLRSRALLIPEGPLVFELISADGGEAKRFTLSPARAASILSGAEAEARGFGLGWDAAPITLKPAPKLTELIRKSRATSTVEEAG